MILLLITVIIIGIGIYMMFTQTNQLRKNILENAESSTVTFEFLASRAIAGEDFLAVEDNLQTLSRTPGFVYGRVLRSSLNENIAELVSKKYKEDFQALIKGISLNQQMVDEAHKSESNIKFIEFAIPGKNEKFFSFIKPVYNPFGEPRTKILGVMEITYSDRVIRDAVQESLMGFILTTIVFLIIGGVGTYFLSSVIVKPIKSLFDGAKIIGDGNLDYEVPVTTEDELGQLAEQFNTMTHSLKTAQKAKEEQLVLDEQIRQAQEIQEGMNPMNLLDKEKFQIKGYTRAAKGVGGDYFDFQLLPDKRLALLISDVSGKGVSASLVMVLIKTVVSTYLQLFSKIRSDHIVSTINEVMATQTHIDKFATMMFILYDPDTGSVEFTNGGQGPLFVYRAASKVCTVSKLPGLPLGIDEDNDYSIAGLNLLKDDMVVLYTDGITEAWNKNKDEFSLNSLRQKIIEYAPLPVDEIVSRIITDIDNFADGMEQHDDMTLVVLKVK